MIRDADAILAMMDQTPADDWDDVDRTMLRDDAVQEAFGTRRRRRRWLARCSGSRAIRGCASTTRRARTGIRRSCCRSPSRRAACGCARCAPAQRSCRCSKRPTARRIAPVDGAVVDGPPAWLVADRTAYLLDGSFDPRRVIAAARAAADGAGDRRRRAVGAHDRARRAVPHRRRARATWASSTRSGPR